MPVDIQSILTLALWSSSPLLLPFHLFSNQEKSALCQNVFPRPCAIDSTFFVLRKSLKRSFFPLCSFFFGTLAPFLPKFPNCTVLDKILQTFLTCSNRSLLVLGIVKNRATKTFRFLSHIPNFVAVVMNLAHNSEEGSQTKQKSIMRKTEKTNVNTYMSIRN